MSVIDPQGSGLVKEFFVPFCLMILVRTLFVDWFQVPSSSMSPIIYRGDYVLVAKYRYGYSANSITLNLGSWLVPRRVRYYANGTPIPINYESNVRTVAAQIPYIKLGAPRVGDLVCIADPRLGGLNLTKRVVGVSGDTFQMFNNNLYLNDEPCQRTYLGSYYYLGDFGRLEEQNCYKETLPNGFTHIIQYTKGYPTSNTERFTIHPAVTVALLGRIVQVGYFAVVGSNRDGSTDSRQGTVMLHCIPEEWLFGAVLGTLCSTYLTCSLPTVPQDKQAGWIEFILRFPWNFLVGMISVLSMPERIGLINDEPHRRRMLSHSVMRTLCGPSAPVGSKLQTKHLQLLLR